MENNNPQLEAIDLTKNEIDNINLRSQLISQKEIEANIMRRELQFYLESLMAKYKLDGLWKLEGERLVKKEFSESPQDIIVPK